ncbi:hypothetical protein RB195_016077 [Necator americanus]|uniref:Secreted protein n=1 Tax=Necator americanus TaxID=51031 RepID=A0ABR1E7G5_NECAM
MSSGRIIFFHILFLYIFGGAFGLKCYIGEFNSEIRTHREDEHATSKLSFLVVALQLTIVNRVIEIWQRHSKPMQLAFLDLEATFDSPHRGHFNALRTDRVPGELVVPGVRRGPVARPFLFNFAIGDTMRRTVD